MNQSAVEFDEAELQRCQPVEMVCIHGSKQLTDASLAMLFSETFCFSVSSVAALSEQLLLPPSIDAFGLQIRASWMSRTLNKCIAVAM